MPYRTAYFADLMEIPLASSTIAKMCKGMRIMVYYVHDEGLSKKTVGYEGEILAIKRAFAVSESGKADDITDVILVASVQYSDETAEEEELKFSDFWSCDTTTPNAMAPEDAWRFCGDDNLNMLIQNMIIDKAVMTCDTNFVPSIPSRKRTASAATMCKVALVWLVLVAVGGVFFVVRADRTAMLPPNARKACDRLMVAVDVASAWLKKFVDNTTTPTQVDVEDTNQTFETI